MSDIPKGIGPVLRVRDLKPGMEVALRYIGEFRVVKVTEIARFAVVFDAGDGQIIYQRFGDNLDAITGDSLTETHMFAYTP